MPTAAPVIASVDQIAVTTLRGVGPRLAEKLVKLGIASVQDLLFHLPLRYQDRTRMAPIGSLRPGDEVVVEGQVLLAQIHMGRRRSLLVRIADGTGTLTLRFFYFNKSQETAFARGKRFRCFGEARPGPETLEFVHPEYRAIEADEPPAMSDCLTPIYPATEGLAQPSLRNLTDQALDLLREQPESLRDWLPATMLHSLKLPALHQAVELLHRPSAEISLQSLGTGKHPAMRRLVFEELLAHQLSLRRLRDKTKHMAAPVLATNGHLVQRLLAALPFQLTGAQRRVTDEINRDLEQAQPMLRLVQGDVGSGKTVVAALAALAAVETGWQVAIMAPTEILAEQHLRSFESWLAPLGVSVQGLSGKVKGRAREQVLEAVAKGESQVLVGTHALFQDEVVFSRLGLVIIDEQHRFGVHQRLALRDKGSLPGWAPHQLIMTATPIPRTLAMTAYADLDVSVIDELPAGRQPIETVVVPDRRRPEVVQRIQAVSAAGRQVYWVCSLIEESDLLDAQAAEHTATELAAALPNVRVGLVHGRLKSQEKEAVMGAFKRHEIDVLVATTVIEVGVDVPNASLMVIDNSERLGLAQLHQLRGRVGRGTEKSTCVLLFQGGLSEQSRARLAAMRETTDGFEIARRDLELRGPGEVLGTRQTGALQWRIADLARDQDLLPVVQRTADLLLRDYPENVEPLINRWVREGMRFADA